MKTKNMRNILFCLYFVLSMKEVCGERDNDIRKKGIYPYMAVVYYPDVTIVGPSGDRFTRSAVIIRTDWLISSSLETNDTRLAFPQKTLVARAGAIALDSNFTSNEDEEEQEQEIIQIVRPTNFTINQWWNNDMSLLKTLMPFTMTPTVASTTLSVKQNYTYKTCYILVFAKKYRNSTYDKVLMELTVELLPGSTENCGQHFRNETMICASNSDENKNTDYEPDFCYTNGGGPLICENDVIGLQTYIGNNCKQPYLYQLLSAWDDFITCGVEDKCRMKECANICVNIEKDDDGMTWPTEITNPTSETVKEIMDQSTDDSNDEEHLILTDTTKVTLTTVNENETPSPTTLSTVERITSDETSPRVMSETYEKATGITEELETSWPKEKIGGTRKKLDDDESSENIERKSNVEVQRRVVKTSHSSNAAERYVIDKMGLTMVAMLTFEILFFICSI